VWSYDAPPPACDCASDTQMKWLSGGTIWKSAGSLQIRHGFLFREPPKKTEKNITNKNNYIYIWKIRPTFLSRLRRKKKNPENEWEPFHFFSEWVLLFLMFPHLRVTDGNSLFYGLI
jgi:hypothetical protein